MYLQFYLAFVQLEIFISLIEIFAFDIYQEMEAYINPSPTSDPHLPPLVPI